MFRPCRSSRLRRFTPLNALQVYCALQPTMGYTQFLKTFPLKLRLMLLSARPRLDPLSDRPFEAFPSLAAFTDHLGCPSHSASYPLVGCRRSSAPPLGRKSGCCEGALESLAQPQGVAPPESPLTVGSVATKYRSMLPWACLFDTAWMAEVGVLAPKCQCTVTTLRRVSNPRFCPKAEPQLIALARRPLLFAATRKMRRN